jgi:hypothetical protein
MLFETSKEMQTKEEKKITVLMKMRKKNSQNKK